MKLGIARTILGYGNLIHIIRLDKYQQTIDGLEENLENFHHTDDMADSLLTTKTKLSELKQKLQALLPGYRTKRGLINGLGTLIKGITGNMDANDALHLNQQIEEILNMNKNITNNMKTQSKLNHDMIQRFENITGHINSQQKIIAEYLNYTNVQFENKIRKHDVQIKYIQFLNHINYNIDILSSHLNSISEAIILAKLNLISKQILNQKELAKIHVELNKQNVTIKSSQNVYEFLGLQAYFNDTNIIFNVQIPILSNETYHMFHVIPLPLEQNKFIITKPYLILNPQNIQFFDNKCPKLEGVFYCQRPAYKEETNKSRCIGNLILNKPAHCELQVADRSSEIYQPEPNYIIFINAPETQITSTCGVDNQRIKGSILIHFGNCDVKINNIIYTSTVETYWDEVNIHPTIFHEVNATTPNHTLYTKPLDNFKFSDEQLMSFLEPYALYVDLQGTVFILTSILILVTIVAYMIMRYHIRNIFNSYNTNNPSNMQNNRPADDPQNIRFIWPSPDSRGGGVTSA